MGTPAFACESLKALLDAGHDIPLVVTRPDAVRSRGKKLVPSEVKALAQSRELCVLEAAKVTSEVYEAVKAAAPELIVVVAYGAFLPDKLLALPRYGAINVHGSLLPAWRGAAPIQRALLSGDKHVGVSIMKLVHEMDAGPYCAQVSLEPGDMCAPEVFEKLASMGAKALVESIEQLEAGTLVWHEQYPTQVSFAQKIDKHEMFLSPDVDAETNRRRVAASTDAAPARVIVSGKAVRVLSAHVLNDAELEARAAQLGTDLASASAGQVFATKKKLLLACNPGILEISDVKPDGKKAMPASAFIAGLHELGNWKEL